MRDLRRIHNLLLLVVAAGALIGGVGARWLGHEEWTFRLIVAGTIPVLLVVLRDSAASLVRREIGLDIIALLSIGGALILRESVAAGVIAVMLSGGRALEDFAAARAGHQMSALLAHVPRFACRYERGDWITVSLDSVVPGDRLLVRPGEIVPVDGVVNSGAAVLDEAVLTGESAPVTHTLGQEVRSGTINAGASFQIKATDRASDSTYARIVQLVRKAQEERAPAVRLADRAAFVFTPLAIALAAIAWVATGDPVRGLAVMVVATPCPLILGVPVALVSGLSRCAGHGILVKGGGTLEALARVRTLFLDKTGTLTAGRARVASVEVAPQEAGSVVDEEVLRLAASLDQTSLHVIAQIIVAAAQARGLSLVMPEKTEEEPGAGVSGIVEGRYVSVGSHAYVARRTQPTAWSERLLRRMGYEGVIGVFVAANGGMIGAILLVDEIRPESPRALRLLRHTGITRTVMLTGDRREIAQAIGAALGVDEVRAEQQPEDKLAAITEARQAGEACGMVGDGVNDAPALAAADVGIAMGVRGSGASSEAADVVLLTDRLDRLADAFSIARATRRIAVQTVSVGMGLSALAMVTAAFGFLPPVGGALLQEVIDVAAILNALRVLRVRVPGRPGATLPVAEVARLQAEHEHLAGPLARLRTIADELAILPPAKAASALREVERQVRENLLHHEQADDAMVYPQIERMLGDGETMAPMHRTHREVQRLGGLLAQMICDLPAEGPDPIAVNDFRRVLYGLDAILRLHFAQENELYQSLAASTDDRATRLSAGPQV